jgi:hypothetical protein
MYKRRKVMKKISILLIICFSLLLLMGCDKIGITPEIVSGNLEYQGDTNDTGTVDTGDTIATEGAETVSKIKIDKTPPVVTITLPGTGVYFLNQAITATWSATDALSGVVAPASGSVSINTSSVGTKTLTLPAGTAKDKAGNSSRKVTKSYKVIKDQTPPVVTITLPGTGEYVLNQLITATWSATDALSGVVAPASGSVSINTSSVGTKTLTLPAGTAKDKAGNSSRKVTKSYKVIKVDTTKPVITGSRAPLPNSFGWNNTDVTVSFSCADTGAVQSGIAINTVAGKTLTTEGKDQSVTNTGTCIDVAGNTADPATVSNINIDKTPPVVTIILPGTGEYVLNQLITAIWSATDALSGVVSPVSGFVLIDTSSVGMKTFTLPAGTAKDKAGNSSLKVTISYSVIEDAEDLGAENPQKWFGLTGFSTWYSAYEGYGDIWLANEFTETRYIPDYFNASEMAGSKAAVIAGTAMGLRFIWGVSSAGATLTAANWSDFSDAVLAAAQWAQDNGVYEFQIGNEEELHNDDDTLTDAQLVTNLKALATDVQEIFTNGNVSYATSWDYDALVAAGRGDIDLIGLNIYRGSDVGTFNDNWKWNISWIVSIFGTDALYVTEFNLSSKDINNYSTNEAVQAVGITEMIEYFKTLGVERALFYSWHDYPGGLFGVVKDDGTYRLLWSQALLNSDSVKFATVPTKNTIASLP